MTADIHSEILDDLAAQYIYPLPSKIKTDPVMVCFSIEQAFWHFQTISCRTLKRGSMQEFTRKIFHHLEFLREHADYVSVVLEEWEDYKSRIPTFGAVMLNKRMDKVQLVKSAKGFWSFPKGKINEFEEPEDCAAREVLEEVGLGIQSLINRNIFFQHAESNHFCRLYIIPGVKESATLSTSCPQEIRDIKWFKVEYLPMYLKDERYRSSRQGISWRKFFNVIPFMPDIAEWVAEENEWQHHKIIVEQRQMTALGLPLQFRGRLN